MSKILDVSMEDLLMEVEAGDKSSDKTEGIDEME